MTQNEIRMALKRHRSSLEPEPAGVTNGHPKFGIQRKSRAAAPLSPIARLVYR
jgi:hypothetical protein